MIIEKTRRAKCEDCGEFFNLDSISAKAHNGKYFCSEHCKNEYLNLLLEKRQAELQQDIIDRDYFVQDDWSNVEEED